MGRPAVSRRGLARHLVYIYHPVVAKLLTSLTSLGLLLVIVSQTQGRLALVGIHNTLSATLVPSVLLLAILFALSTLLPFFPEYLVTVMAGFVFGTLDGGIFSITAITLAASGNFQIARRYGQRVIHLIFDLHSRREIVWTAGRIGGRMVFLTWLLPSINFDLISYAGGLSAMPYGLFLALTIAGNLLSGLLLAFLGSGLHTNSAVAAILILLGYTLIGAVLYMKELPPRFATPPIRELPHQRTAQNAGDDPKEEP